MIGCERKISVMLVSHAIIKSNSFVLQNNMIGWERKVIGLHVPHAIIKSKFCATKQRYDWLRGKNHRAAGAPRNNQHISVRCSAKHQRKTTEMTGLMTTWTQNSKSCIFYQNHSHRFFTSIEQFIKCKKRVQMSLVLMLTWLVRTTNLIWADLGYFATFPIGMLLQSAVFKLQTKNKREWKFHCPSLPHDFFRVAVVDGIYVFIKSGIRLRLDLLNFLQPSTGHKQPARLRVIGKNLRELSNNVLQNLRWCISQQRF